MKPEIQSVNFSRTSLYAIVTVNDSLTVTVTLPIPSNQYENMTVAQIREAAIQHAKNQHRD